MTRRKKAGNVIPPLGNYANFITIRFNLKEVILDFGQRVPDSDLVRLHTRIITSPQHLIGFKKVIDETLNDIGKKATELTKQSDDEDDEKTGDDSGIQR